MRARVVAAAALASALAVARGAASPARPARIPLRVANPIRTGRWEADPDLSGRLAREAARVNARFAPQPPTYPPLARRSQAQLYDMSRDSFYVMDVQVGTPAQTISLLCDTASSDIIIATEDCHTAACAGLTKFLPGQSSTLQNSTQQFSITYGSGAATGDMASDIVSVGGYTVASQSFALVNQMQSGTVSAPISGIFGVGLQELSAAGVTPFTEVLAKEGVLDQPVFSVQVARAGDSTLWGNTSVASSSAEETEEGALLGGIFTLGSIDESQYDGDLNWIDVPSKSTSLGYWSVPLQSLSLNGTSQEINLVACLDLGTTYLAAPPDWTAEFYAQIEGSAKQDDFATGRYSIPCSAKVNVTLTFGGVEYAINATDFNAGTINNGTDCLGAFFASDSLSSTPSSYPSFIIGATWLKNVFFAANMSGPSIGLASLKTGRAQALATDVPTPAVTASTPMVGSTSTVASSGTLSSSISLPRSSNAATQISSIASDQPSGPGLGSPSPTPTSTASSADAAATGAQEALLTQASGALDMAGAHADAEAGYVLAADTAGTSRRSSSLSVGSGRMLATASNGSLFASSTASFTSVSVAATVAKGTRVHWASGLSAPRGFANADRSAASLVLHSGAHPARGPPASRPALGALTLALLALLALLA